MLKYITDRPRTTSFELQEACKELKIPLRSIAFKDQLARLTPVQGAYIINMANSGSAGTHWIALWNYRDRQNKSQSIYFDSFGLPPPIEVTQFAKRYGDLHVVANTRQLQPTDEGFCGQFCLLFLYYVQLNRLTEFYHAFCNVRRF
jgi:hypothetical protein